MSDAPEPAGRGQRRDGRSALAAFDEAFLPPQQDTPAEERPRSFEERALASGDNPLEHIDRLLRRTSPRLWLGVAALVVLVGSAVAWTAVAKRTVTAQTQAILVPDAGLFSVGEQVTAQVVDVSVEEGDVVLAGARLAQVATPTGPADITSPIGGVVVAVDVREGELHSAGDAMFVVTPTASGLSAIALFSPGALAGIEVGQPALVTVNGISADRFGRLRGTVASVGDLPASRNRLRQITGDPASAAALAQAGPVYEVRIELERADTPSGLRWTQRQGPEVDVPIGALGIASIVVDRESLITKAFR